MSSTDQFAQALEGAWGFKVKIASLPIHLFPSADSQAFDYATGIALPAVGAQGVVVQFTVPDGQNGIIVRFGNEYIGSGFTDYAGSLQWQLLEDGTPIANYENILASLGSTAIPSTVSSIRIKENSRVQLVINNISLVVGGAMAGGRLGGWFYPKDQDPETTWQ
jgi:hypothetical protein